MFAKRCAAALNGTKQATVKKETSFSEKVDSRFNVTTNYIGTFCSSMCLYIAYRNGPVLMAMASKLLGGWPTARTMRVAASSSRVVIYEDGYKKCLSGFLRGSLPREQCADGVPSCLPARRRIVSFCHSSFTLPRFSIFRPTHRRYAIGDPFFFALSYTEGENSLHTCNKRSRTHTDLNRLQVFSDRHYYLKYPVVLLCSLYPFLAGPRISLRSAFEALLTF